MGTTSLAVISGGTGFVGSAIANTLQESGWEVVALAREEGEGVYRCDITKESDVISTVKSITEKYGTIRACIHAAAPGMDSPDQKKVAVDGAKFLATAAAPHMEKGAVFIGITSTLTDTEKALPNMKEYIEAKQGLRDFLRELSSNSSIRVYAVAPGFMEGGLNKSLPGAVLDFLAQKTGAGKARVEDVATLVRTLCEEKNAYPTGTSISVPSLTTETL